MDHDKEALRVNAPQKPRQQSILEEACMAEDKSISVLHDLISQLESRLEPVCNLGRTGEVKAGSGTMPDSGAFSQFTSAVMGFSERTQAANSRLRNLLEILEV